MNAVGRSWYEEAQPTITSGTISLPDPGTYLRRFAARANGWLEMIASRLPHAGEAPLALDLPERTVTFNGLAEFEFCLDSKTQYPVRRVAELIGLSSDALRRAAIDIRRVEKRFAGILSRSIEEPDSIGELLLEAEGKLFSQDHDWRDMVEVLAHKPPMYNVYKRILLVKYIQYLGSRQDVLRSLYAARRRESPTRPSPESTPGIPSAAPTPSTRADDTRIAAFTETAIFDLSEIRAAGGDLEFRPLPRGEAVRVELRDGREMALRLAGDEYKLFPGPRFHLLDGAGRIHPLKSGRNVVGRHADNDVVTDPSRRSISRQHLLIEPLAFDAVLLTDLSSLGTSIPQAHS